MRTLLSFVILIFLLTSCSLKKRTYTAGYYVSWAFHKKHAEVRAVKQITQKTEPIKDEVLTEIVWSVTASNSKLLENYLEDRKPKINLLADTCGDVIIFKTGETVTAKVYEITDDHVKYKRCDNLDGPTFNISKTTIQSIKYSNGVIERIETPTATVTPQQNIQKPINSALLKTHPKANWALGLLIAGFVPFFFFIPWIISLVLASFAIEEIEQNPTVYKGLELAHVVKIIDAILLLLCAALIILLIVLVFALI